MNVQKKKTNNLNLIKKLQFLFSQNNYSFLVNKKKNLKNLIKNIKKNSSKHKNNIDILKKIFLNDNNYIPKKIKKNTKILIQIRKKIINIKSIKLIFINGFLIYIPQKKYIKQILKININKKIETHKILSLYNKKNNSICLNNILVNQIIDINITKNKKIKLPIYLIIINNYKTQNTINNYSLNFTISKNTELTIIEHNLSFNKKKLYSNNNIHINLHKKVSLNYLKIINLNKNSIFFSNEKINLNKNSNLEKKIFMLNSQKININTYINLKKKTQTKINSISLIKKNNNFQYKIYLLHKYKKSKSYQKHKNIFLNTGKFLFNGLVKIYKNAKYSNAYIENNNLCVNKNFSLTSYPKLKIYNKNSICKHKCTINKIEKNYIFLLLLRGINKKEIKKIIYLSFIKEIIYNISEKKIKKIINNIINKYII